MDNRRPTLALLVSLVSLATCCTPATASRFQLGLSNAQSEQRDNPARDPTEPYDVVANGPRSCGTEGGPADPLPYRYPPCGMANAQKSNIPFLPPVPTVPAAPPAPATPAQGAPPLP